MNLGSELIVSVVGGVATAAILSLFSRGGEQVQRTPARESGRGRSLLGDLIHMIFAVSAGIAIAMIGGRMLIQSGALEKGIGGRLVLLVAGTALAWLLLLPLRRR